jgi:hypothetical protein
MPDDVGRELADLPPEEFTAARDALAKRLKAEGAAAQAAAVKKLRKPTVSQWVVEQVRRHHHDEIDALRVASRDVAAAQEAAITSGDRDALRSATGTRRDVVKAVARAVDDVLTRLGRSAQYRDEVLSAIESAVTAEVASGTFGVRDDLELPKRARREPARDVAAERQAAQAQAAIEAAEARVHRAREELEKAESALSTARSRASQDFGVTSPELLR